MPEYPVRIGVILTELGGLNSTALKYLILYQNTLQKTFQFELLPVPDSGDKFLGQLDSPVPIDREKIEKQMDAFVSRYKKWLEKQAEDFDITPTLPDGYVIMSTVKFDDNYFLTGNDELGVIALGHWKRYMAPPSIVEFFLNILIELSIDFACGEDVPRHLTTRGCVFDFTVSLDEARLAVLTGYVCESCRKIITSRHERIYEDAKLLLQMNWLGDSSVPATAALTADKLGYDLFHTKGITPTFLERIRSSLEKEGLKALLQILAATIIAALLIWLGLKKS